jgi:tetratricopeptide (TPR) repeat protein
MKRWGWLLALLVALPIGAQDKKKDDKKDEKKGEAKKPAVVTVDELFKQADEKIAAGDADGAADTLRKAAGMDPGGEASLRLGRVLEGKYDLDSAIDAYKAAADKLSGAAKGEALARMAIAQETRGVAEAAATAEAAAAADPAGAWPTIALSRARARQGKADDAVSLAQKAEGAGGGAAASSALGYAQEAKGDLAAAEKAYRAAQAADAKAVAPVLGLARVLRKTGRAAEAEPLLQQVLATAPGAVEAYKESARVKLAQNKADQAYGDAATAAAMGENDPEAQSLLQEVTVAKALAQVATGQVDLAIQDLTALRDQHPNLAVARVGLAKALVAKRQPDPAIAELQKAVELDPKSAEANYQLGYIQYVMKGNPTGALAPYEKAVALDPGNVQYRTYLGAVLGDLKQTDRAVDELTKVTTSPGYNRAEAWIYLGRAYVGAKRYKEAIPPLEKATTIAPDVADAWANLGWCYFGLKDADNFKRAAGKAKGLGYKEPTLLQYLTRVEGGEPIK